MRFKVGDKVAFDVAWNVQFGEVFSTKGLFKQELLIMLDKGGSDIVPASLCIRLNDEEYKRLKELHKKKGKK